VDQTGSNGSDDSSLRRSARAAIVAGTLPLHAPLRMWGGSGTGERCAICSCATEEGGAAIELEFDRGEQSDGTHHHFVHPRCLAAWEHERTSKNGRTPGLGVLPDEGSASTLDVRERATEGGRTR
jgi:hypothetical protein